MSQLTWCGPSSRSTSFMAVKIGRSGQPVQNEGGRRWTWPSSERHRGLAAMRTAPRAGRSLWRGHRADSAHELADTPSRTTPPVYSPAIGSMSLPWMLGLHVGAAEDRVDRLLDEFRLALLDDQHRALAVRRSG